MWIMLQQEDPDDYVICTGNTYTIRQFLERSFAYVGIEDWQQHVIVDPEFYRPAEVDYLKGNARKAEAFLGWTPKNDLNGLVNIMMKHDLHENIQSLP
jgi:GDPmannose 4,6-dehydratase